MGHSNYDLFFENLSTVYVLSVVISISVVLLTYVMKKTNTSLGSKEKSNRLGHPTNSRNEDDETSNKSDEDVNSRVDSPEFSGHLAAHFKRVKLQETKNAILDSMSEEEKLKEQKIQQEQLDQIFNLMQENKDVFGDTDVVDVEEQMKLYS